MTTHVKRDATPSVSTLSDQINRWYRRSCAITMSGAIICYETKRYNANPAIPIRRQYVAECFTRANTPGTPSRRFPRQKYAELISRLFVEGIVMESDTTPEAWRLLKQLVELDLSGHDLRYIERIDWDTMLPLMQRHVAQVEQCRFH